MSPNPQALAFLGYFLWAIIAYAVSYLLLGFGLSLLGARVRQRSTWLAWLPVFNFYLMCRLAQVSLLLILPMLIPVLNFLVFAYLGFRMAKRVGRSGGLGVLFGVPVLGNLIPLVLALGKPTEEEKAAPPPAQPPLVTALIHTGVVFAILVAPIAIWASAKRLSRDTTPAPTVQQAAAPLPKNVAGTMTEFPIDSATTGKATASDLSTVTFAKPQPGEKPSVGLNSEQLPPWIKGESISTLAESATTASYNSAATVAPVKVVSLALRPESAGDLAPPTAKELAAIDPAATAKGIEVKTADNAVYRGYRVNTPTSAYYALRRSDSNSLVLISAKDTAGVPVAERLAANLGNGSGLLADDLARAGVAKLPPPPPGMKLVRLETATTAQIDAITERLNDKAAMDKFFKEQENRQDSNGRNDATPQVIGLVKAGFELGKLIMPRSYTAAFYDTPTAKGAEAFGAGVAGFPSSSDAWTALQAFGGCFKLYSQIGQPITIENIEVGGYSGLAVSAVDVSGTAASTSPGHGGSFAVIALRDGAFVRAFITIRDKEQKIASPEDLRSWAEAAVKGK